MHEFISPLMNNCVDERVQTTKNEKHLRTHNDVQMLIRHLKISLLSPYKYLDLVSFYSFNWKFSTLMIEEKRIYSKKNEGSDFFLKSTRIYLKSFLPLIMKQSFYL